MFRTHQDGPPCERALVGICDMEAANRYLTETYPTALNAESVQPAMEKGSAFVGWIGGLRDDILAERFECTVGYNNCIRFEGMTLQIPADRHRCHYVKVKVSVLRRIDGSLAVFHDPRKLADYEADGRFRLPEMKAVAQVRRGLSGQFICYNTGQIYLLPTANSG